MSLSVTSSLSGAPGALALLQALSPTSAHRSSAPGAVADPPAPAGVPSSTSPAVSAAPQSLFALADGVGQALTAADAADAAGQGVLDLLHQMHAAAGQAADLATSTDQRAALDHRFQASGGQIAPTLAGATLNGVNLVDGSSASGLKVPLGDGASTTLAPVDLTPGGPTLALSPAASLATAAGAASAAAGVSAAIGAASAGLSTLQAQADQIGAHASFVQALGQALAAPDRDGGDSVRLMALQLSQQLSAQPAAIANQSPQAILSLFRT